ncbi:unnamed protein product [Clonostachys solani]|uniref:Uncharacterized protein n=1 Tax=Clonostachys solani TaxID=160281 RepID=A0A9N9ZKB4_9HYPO|nr:unnamed protein product [Clonostachys solani]
MSWGLAAIEASRSPEVGAVSASRSSVLSIFVVLNLPFPTSTNLDRPEIQSFRGRESATSRAAFASQSRCSADFHMQGGQCLVECVRISKRDDTNSLTTYITYTRYREQL